MRIISVSVIVFISSVFLLSSFTGMTQTVNRVNIQQLDSLMKQAKHPLVINFWATFCKPCIEEIPYFEQNLLNYKHTGVQLWLVSLDLPDYFPARISGFAAKKNFTSPLLWLDETNADIFCPVIDKRWSGAIPATLMLHPGKNYRKFYETQLTPLQLQKALHELLD